MKAPIKKIIIPANRKRSKWIVDDLVQCARCWYQWTAVYEEWTDKLHLECPKCGGRLTVVGKRDE